MNPRRVLLWVCMHMCMFCMRAQHRDRETSCKFNTTSQIWASGAAMVSNEDTAKPEQYSITYMPHSFMREAYFALRVAKASLRVS
jgi:hypothetical protein